MIYHYLISQAVVLDPWGNPYEYELDEGIVFGPQSFETHIDETIIFTAMPGEGTIVVENSPKGVTSGGIEINGEEIVSPYEFQHKKSRIEKTIYNLDRSNILHIWLHSDPHDNIVIKITSALSKNTTFTLYSKGRNGAKNSKEDVDYDDIKYGDF